ncbi:hypothetical protein ABK040_012675 [Willaertia magna]
MIERLKDPETTKDLHDFIISVPKITSGIISEESAKYLDKLKDLKEEDYISNKMFKIKEIQLDENIIKNIKFTNNNGVRRILQENIIKLEYLNAIKEYNKIATREKLIKKSYNYNEIENKFRRKLFNRTKKLNEILQLFVKYNSKLRTNEFNSRFLRAIGESYKLSRKLDIVTVEQIFRSIDKEDVTLDTLRALILCYANFGFMKEIPNIFNKMNDLIGTGILPINGNLKKEKEIIENFKLRCTFEALAHCGDFNAIEKLIILKRNDWIRDYKINIIYDKIIYHVIHFFLVNNKFKMARTFIDLLYKHNIPRGNDPSTFLVILRVYKGSFIPFKKNKKIERRKLLDQNLKLIEFPREYMDNSQLFEFTIIEMKKLGIEFTKNIYKTITIFYYRKKSYSRVIFYFEELLRNDIVPSKLTFIYAEESYLILGKIIEASKTHQLRLLYFRRNDVPVIVRRLGHNACIQYLLNYAEKKAKLLYQTHKFLRIKYSEEGEDFNVETLTPFQQAVWKSGSLVNPSPKPLKEPLVKTFLKDLIPQILEKQKQPNNNKE